MHGSMADDGALEAQRRLLSLKSLSDHHGEDHLGSSLSSGVQAVRWGGEGVMVSTSEGLDSSHFSHRKWLLGCYFDSCWGANKPRFGNDLPFPVRIKTT